MNRWIRKLIIVSLVAGALAMTGYELMDAAESASTLNPYLWKNWEELSEPARAVWLSILQEPGWTVTQIAHISHQSIALTTLRLSNELTGQTANLVAEAKHIAEANLWTLSWKTGHKEGLWRWNKIP